LRKTVTPKGLRRLAEFSGMTNSEFTLEEHVMRFKKELLTAFVGINLSLFVGLANADTIEHTITFGTTVPSSCSITGTPTLADGEFSEIEGTESKFTVDVTGTTANPTAGKLTIGTVACTSNKIDVTMTPSGSIKHVTAPANYIEYAAYILDNGTKIAEPNVNTNTLSSAKTVTINKQSSTVGVEISTQERQNLMAGTYVATLNINITPN
jgi:hypothetical protein